MHVADGFTIVSHARLSPLHASPIALVAVVTTTVAFAIRRANARARTVVKTCRACGTEYQRATWQKLAFVGTMDSGFGDMFELRNCRCGSTLMTRA